MSGVAQKQDSAPSYENHEIFHLSIGMTCIGAYDFKSTNKGDLPFKKGEILNITQLTRDPNWYKAKNAAGQQGMIPSNYVVKHQSNDKALKEIASNQKSRAPPPPSQNAHKEVKLHAMPWFHGKISRMQAEELLKPRRDGLFLLRESTNYQGDYTLCVCFESQVEHYRIIFKDNKVTIDEEEYFENLTHLVEHYEGDADGLVCELREPLKKQGGLDFSVDTEDFRKSGWEIPSCELHLGSVLGKGEFGDVYEGTYKGQKVAVKSVKDKSKAAQAFLAEASVMTKLNHKNLVRLLGVVIPKRMSNDPIYVVLEFMTKGALLEYLRSRGRALLSQADLIGFARDVACGMAYLEEKKLVHRDLAARNILVSEDGSAKVSDFGLARDEQANLQGGKFPVKWTAPEALKQSKFSNKSDVWSYGVMLWEIWSFGRVPYPRVPLKDVLSKVMDGYRMDKPDRCPEEIYCLMKKCWDINPDTRISFVEVIAELDKIKKGPLTQS
ncbi:tyrosine-protein kinase CSK-like [Styela clava]|uniref:tyrosine-protein kinase CSK-like n=1 Tax=Styela clava TaxID=7725 RepID=UPI00193AB41F|nr:tyrosine-protein kinase CSK-like [Styela clava]